MLSDLQLTFRKSESWLIQATFSSRMNLFPLSLRSPIHFIFPGSVFGSHIYFIIFLTEVEQDHDVLNPQVLCE